MNARRIALFLLPLLLAAPVRAAEFNDLFNRQATAGLDFDIGEATLVTPLALGYGGTGEPLAAPAADRILFYDFSAGEVTWLTVGSGLSLSGTTLTATGGGGGGAGTLSMIKGNGSQVGDADIETLDFSSDFGVSESPDTEINITLDSGITRDSEVNGYFSDPSTNGSFSASAWRTDLSLIPGTHVQTQDSDLTLWGAITPSSDVQSFNSAANYAAMRTAIGLTIGGTVQGYDADLDDLADGSLTGTKVAAATTSAQGAAELATNAETITGTDTGRVVTPAGFAAGFDSRIATSGAAEVADLRVIKGWKYWGGSLGDFDTANTANLQAWFDGDWGDNRLPLKFRGDIYAFNDTVLIPPMTGSPSLEGMGEHIWHATDQYGVGTYPATFTDGTFVASTGVYTCGSAQNLSGFGEGMWVYLRVDGSPSYAAIARIVSVNDGADTITVSTTPLKGTMSDMGAGTATIEVAYQRGGPVTIFQWTDASISKYMLRNFAYGGRIRSINGQGKHAANGISLVTDAATAWVTSTAYDVGDRVSRNSYTYICTTAGTSAAGPSGTGSGITDGTCVWSSYTYPYPDPTVLGGTHAEEDRCLGFMQIEATYQFGNGKHHFPDGINCTLFQVGVKCTDDETGSLSDETYEHNDQCHVGGRSAFYFCDIGFWNDQLQAFHWHFRHIDCGNCTYPLYYTGGGKLTVDTLDVQVGCKAALNIAGSNQDVGPGVFNLRYVSFDETSDADSQILIVDSQDGGAPDSAARTYVDSFHLTSTRANATDWDDNLPIATIVDSYGVHVFSQGDNCYDGMLHVEGGTSTVYPTIILQECGFEAGRHDVANVEKVFDEESEGWVQFVFEKCYEQHAGSGETNSGQLYADETIIGSFDGMGVFTPGTP
jgi:hypothetical protein